MRNISSLILPRGPNRPITFSLPYGYSSIPELITRLARDRIRWEKGARQQIIDSRLRAFVFENADRVVVAGRYIRHIFQLLSPNTLSGSRAAPAGIKMQIKGNSGKEAGKKYTRSSTRRSNLSRPRLRSRWYRARQRNVQCHRVS